MPTVSSILDNVDTMPKGKGLNVPPGLGDGDATAVVTGLRIVSWEIQ